MWTVVGIGVAMLMEDFFDAVTRAFTKKVDRISLPSRPDPKNTLELLLPTAERTRANSPSDRRRLPERRRLPDRRLPQG